MKAFTVKEDAVIDRVAVNTVPYLHVGVGEEGRGREYIRVALGTKDFGPDTKWFERASVLRTKEKKTLLLVAERDPADRRALVLTDVAAGFRGSTMWTAATYVVKPCPRRGDAGAHYQCDVCGVEYPASKDGDLFWKQENVHPDTGDMRAWGSFPPAGVTVLAQGYKADGIAGRMGGHAVRLLMMEPGSVVRVVRNGRLYGAPAFRYIKWDGERIQLGTRDELFPLTEGEVETAEVL